MTQRTWVILGATSIIAEQFAHLAASSGNRLRLVGRNKEQLELISDDIKLRYQVQCDIVIMEMSAATHKLLTILKKPDDTELDLFIAHSDFTGNDHLNSEQITHLIKTNILSTTLIIHAYLSSKQKEHHLLYLSSVAMCRGRAKNSLYGASKAAIEVYLQGLQQAASNYQSITIARLGFIDTKQTWGLPGIFYAASPKKCANACWKAIKKNKNIFYYPWFWRVIMILIKCLPFSIYKKMKSV